MWRLGRSRGLGRPAFSLELFTFSPPLLHDFMVPGMSFVCFHPRIGWVVSFVAEPIQPVEEVESHCHKNLGGIPKRKQTGSGTRRTAFSTHFLILTAYLLLPGKFHGWRSLVGYSPWDRKESPSAPAPSIQYRASNLDWQLVSYMIFYMFQCHSLATREASGVPFQHGTWDFS